MTIRSFLLQTIFPALLPAADAEDVEFYECLGLDRRSTSTTRTKENKNNNNNNDTAAAAIRKAYRKKSLQLHPDKVAQNRRHADAAATAAKEYELVQEAYACLQDESHRKLYHDYGCSVARYRFVTSQQLYNPVVLGENMARANVSDKTRLFGALSVVAMVLLIQPILIATKVNNSRLENVSWITILIPWWTLHGLLILLLTTLVVLSKGKDLNVLFTTLEMIVWLVGIIRLALAWDDANNNDDDDDDDRDWHSISIPFYCAILCRVFASVAWIQTLQKMQSKMVSLGHLEKTECDGNPLEDQTEERMEEILKKYVVVQVDESVADELFKAYKAVHTTTTDGDDAPDDEEILESIRVQTSEEYNSTQEEINNSYHKIGKYLIYGIPFIMFVTFKLTDGSKMEDQSWWVVFLPILIAVGLPMSINCCFCCCVSPRPVDDDDDDDADDVVIDIHDLELQEENGENNGNAQARNNGGGGGEKSNNNDANIGNSKSESNYSDSTHDKIDEILKETSLTSGRTENLFSSAEGEIPELENVSLEENANGKANNKQKTGTDNKNEKEAKESSENKKKNKESVGNGETNPDAHNEWTTEADKDDDDDDEDEDEDEVEHDSDAFSFKVKALTNCCWYSFQFIILCLIIARLESAYDNDDDDDDDDDESDNDGYNAFWVLFPVFLLTGIILCCCSCMIFGINGEDLDRMKHDINQHYTAQTEVQPESQEGQQQDEENVSSSPAAVVAGTGAPPSLSEIPTTDPEDSGTKPSPDQNLNDVNPEKTKNDNESNNKKESVIDMDDLD